MAWSLAVAVKTLYRLVSVPPIIYRMESFSKDFYICVTPISKRTGTVFTLCGDKIWSFLTAEDLLTISVLSRFCAKLPLSNLVANEIIRRHHSLSRVGNINLSINHPNLTFGIFRRLLNRVVTGFEGELTINMSTGRVVIDIGSAFKDKDAFLASSVTPISSIEGLNDDEPLQEDEKIQKYLEVLSYDEYDDFNPRHPQPKDKTHRRGDSYFNSDIEAHAKDVAFDIQKIADLAIQLEDSNLR